MPKTRGGKAYAANQIKQARKPVPCTLDEETQALLMRAASAAGIKIVEWVGDQANVEMDGGHYGWNPLASWGKGEALSLAVKLRLGLIPLEGGGWDVERFDHRGNGSTLASCANSGEWALQQAIVEAAAKCERPAVAYGVKGMGDCGNAECGWRGPLSECSYVGTVGPCCPACREIVEPDAPGVKGLDQC